MGKKKKATTPATSTEQPALKIGSRVRCDDGVGVQVVQELRRQLANRPSRSDVRVFDAGTAGFHHRNLPHA